MIKKNIEDIYIKLESEGLFNEHLTLYLLDLPDKGLLKKINIKTSKNEIFVFARGFDDKLKKGVSFDVLFPRNSINNFVKCEVTLKYITINPNYTIEYLPRGYSGICLLKFKNVIPYNLINKLPHYDSKMDTKKHDKLILTQRPVVEKIILELEK